MLKWHKTLFRDSLFRDSLFRDEMPFLFAFRTDHFQAQVDARTR